MPTGRGPSGSRQASIQPGHLRPRNLHLPTLEDLSGRYLITPQMGIYGPYYARWSKSGNNKVLFDSTYPDSLAHGYMVDAAGSSSCTEVIGLDKCPNGGGGGEFAPDGSRIVFNCSANAQDLETKTMNPDGSGIQPLNLSVPAEVPRWSPDHLRILLGGCGTTSTSYNGNSICLVNSDGTGFIQLTGSAPDVPQVDLNASWLDWQHIVFASNRDHLS